MSEEKFIAEEIDRQLRESRCPTHGGPDAHLGTGSALDCGACRVSAIARLISRIYVSAATEEREACAKVAEDVAVRLHEQRHDEGRGYNDSLRMSDGADEVADAIRARGAK